MEELIMASEKITSIVEAIEALTLLETKELVEAIEEKFGVSAAPVAVAVAGGAAAPAAEEKTEFDVILANFGAKKLDVILEGVDDEDTSILND